jgi:hypothetical protein
MKRFAQFVVSLVVLAFALTPVFADVKVVPKPDKVKETRAKELEAVSKVFQPWLDFQRADIKRTPAEVKKAFDAMITAWEKLVVGGNYTALVRYADYRHRYAKSQDDSQEAVRLWQAAAAIAATADERKEAENGYWNANLKYVGFILGRFDKPAKK